MAKKSKLCNFFIGVLLFVILVSLSEFLQKERKPTLIEKMASLGKFVSLETKGKALWNVLQKEQKKIQKKVEIREHERNGNGNGNRNGNGNVIEHMKPEEVVLNIEDHDYLPSIIKVNLITVTNVDPFVALPPETSSSPDDIIDYGTALYQRISFECYDVLHVGDFITNLKRTTSLDGYSYIGEEEYFLFQIINLSVMDDKNIYTAEYIDFGRQFSINPSQSLHQGTKISELFLGQPIGDITFERIQYDEDKHAVIKAFKGEHEITTVIDGPTEPDPTESVPTTGPVSTPARSTRLQECGMMEKLMELKEIAEKIVASPELDMQKISQAQTQEEKDNLMINGITSENVYKQIQAIVDEVIKIQYSDLQKCFPEETAIMEQHRGAINQQINKPLIWKILKIYSPETKKLINWGLKMLKEGLNNVQIRNHYISLMTSIDARSEEESKLNTLSDATKPDLAKAFVGALPQPPISSFGKDAPPLFAI